MSDTEKTQLTSTILARQFFTEESAADQLFGKPLQQPATELFKGFHYPLRPDLISMLDNPFRTYLLPTHPDWFILPTNPV